VTVTFAKVKETWPGTPRTVSTLRRRNLKTKFSLWKRIKCFPSTLRRRNLKTQQSPVIFNLRLSKTRAMKYHYCCNQENMIISCCNLSIYFFISLTENPSTSSQNLLVYLQIIEYWVSIDNHHGLSLHGWLLWKIRHGLACAARLLV